MTHNLDSRHQGKQKNKTYTSFLYGQIFESTTSRWQTKSCHWKEMKETFAFIFLMGYFFNCVCFFQANLVVQEARLKVAAAELNSAQAQLDDKQRELDKVQAMYDAAVREKQVTTASTNVYFKIFFLVFGLEPIAMWNDWSTSQFPVLTLD